jgi:PhzF family phenazine biosynthesis protein
MTPNLFHVDVFAAGSLTGNGLTVFLGAERWSSAQMQKLTQEMRQFESIFLTSMSPFGATARVFTVEEELPFAGHPLLGAAAVLHRTQAPAADSCSWEIELPLVTIAVKTRRLGSNYLCEMNQGRPVFGATIPPESAQSVLSRLSLDLSDIAPGLDAQVISTGLPYLIIPVRQDALARAKIIGFDLEATLGEVGAKFVLVFAVDSCEMRTWDNLGQVEDVATGSAAGPAAAYLLNRGLAAPGSPVELFQGRYAGRPSRLTVAQNANGQLLVSGEVWPVSQGVLEIA